MTVGRDLTERAAQPPLPRPGMQEEGARPSLDLRVLLAGSQQSEEEQRQAGGEGRTRAVGVRRTSTWRDQWLLPERGKRGGVERI